MTLRPTQIPHELLGLRLGLPGEKRVTCYLRWPIIFWSKISVGTRRYWSPFDHWTRLVAERLVLLAMVISFDLEVKPTVMLLPFFLLQQRMPRKARRSSLDEQAYMKGLIQLLKYPNQKAKLKRLAMSQVVHAASVRKTLCQSRKRLEAAYRSTKVHKFSNNIGYTSEF